jgi:hypothetical protein
VFFDPVAPGSATYTVSSDEVRQVRQMFVRRSLVNMRGFDLIATGALAPRSLEIGQAGALEFAAAGLQTQGTTLIGAAPRVRDVICAMFLSEGATWQLNGDLELGHVNQGILSVSDAVIRGAPNVRIGAKGRAIGSLSCERSDLELNAVAVGAESSSKGTLDIEGGSTVLADSMVIAGAAKSVGTVRMQGGDTAATSPTLTITGALDVGGVTKGGLGTLTLGPGLSEPTALNSGAAVQVASLSVGKAKRKGLLSQVVVQGPAKVGGPPSTLVVAGAIDVASGGPGKIMVNSGGFVSAVDASVHRDGFIQLEGSEGAQATTPPSLLSLTGALTIDGSGALFVFDGAAASVVGTATVGAASKGRSTIVVKGIGGVNGTGLIAGALVVGGTEKKALGQLFLVDGKVQSGSVHIRPLGRVFGDGEIILTGAGPTAVFRNEGVVSAENETGGITIVGEFDLEATGRLEFPYAATDAKDVAPLELESEFVKLAGTLEVKCGDFVPLSGATFRVIEGTKPFTVTSAPTALRTRVIDKKGKVRPSHPVVLADHVDVVVD